MVDVFVYLKNTMLKNKIHFLHTDFPIKILFGSGLQRMIKCRL